MDSIHARIKARRVALGLSQEKLGELAGVSYQTVQQWEREPDERPDGGRVLSTAPSRKRLPTVAAILGVTEQWLLSGTDDDGQNVDPTVDQLVAFYVGMGDELKSLLLAQANTFYNMSHTERSAANPYPGKLPPKRKRKP